MDLVDLGALSSGFLTGLREGVEAALIIAIICAYLARTGNRQAFRPVFAGAGLAIGLSLVLGIALYVTVGALEEPYEQLFEAAGELEDSVPVQREHHPQLEQPNATTSQVVPG